MLDGAEGSDVLKAGPGNDRLDGGPGSDRLFAGPGADTGRGGPGNDRIQGEGGNDGLSGLDVLLWNAGGKVAGQVERYEDLQIQWGPHVFLPEPKEKGDKKAERDKDKDPEPRVLVVTWLAHRLTVTLDAAVLVDAAPLRAIPGRSRIGLMTWGTDPDVQEIELETVK